MKVYLTVAVLFLMLLTACEDETDKLKEPVDVKFIFDVNHEPVKDGSLVFTGGHIVITQFQFEGKREQGEDVHWFNDYTSGHKIAYDSVIAAEGMDFDLPQGNYTKIAIEFKVEGKDNAGIVAEGRYTTKSNRVYRLLVQINVAEIYSLIARNTDGNRRLLLYKDKPATAKVIFDPGFWLNNVSRESLDKADVSVVDGVNTILISETSNKNIYSKISDKTDKGTEFIFEFD